MRCLLLWIKRFDLETPFNSCVSLLLHYVFGCLRKRIPDHKIINEEIHSLWFILKHENRPAVSCPLGKINVIIEEKDRKGEWLYAKASILHSGSYRI